MLAVVVGSSTAGFAFVDLPGLHPIAGAILSAPPTERFNHDTYLARISVSLITQKGKISTTPKRVCYVSEDFSC